MQHLTIALLQANLVWENASQNRHKFSSKINSLPENVGLIVLPEMFTTGFTMHPKNAAEKMNGNTVKWMQQIASEKNTAICGSIIIEEHDNFYNRFLFVHPNKKVNFYNKRHLFTLAGEDKVYTSGQEKQIVNYAGFKICLQICYDLRFPVFVRNTDYYDAIIYVANWPKPRINAWDILLRARAIENMCYVIGVNRVGKDANNLEYNGHSAVYDCLGDLQTNEIETNECIKIVQLTKGHISTTRSKLNFLEDRDRFKLLP